MSEQNKRGSSAFLPLSPDDFIKGLVDGKQLFTNRNLTNTGIKSGIKKKWLGLTVTVGWLDGNVEAFSLEFSIASLHLSCAKDQLALCLSYVRAIAVSRIFPSAFTWAMILMRMLPSRLQSFPLNSAHLFLWK